VVYWPQCVSESVIHRPAVLHVELRSISYREGSLILFTTRRGE
jgi:hypothetical protein